MGVDARADGGAAEGDLGQLGGGVLEAPDGALGLAGVAAELLAEADGRGVLQVRAAGLDDGPELFRLGLQRRLQLLQRGGEVLLDGGEGGDVDGRRDDVVGGLAHVDVIVGVHEAVAAVAAEELGGAVGDDLVGVGVGGGAGAGLEDVEDEVVVEVAVDDLLGGGVDGAAEGGVEEAELDVGIGGGLLDEAEGAMNPREKRRSLMGKLRTARMVEAP